MINKCLRCKRPLKIKDSIQRGYGKKCFELIFGKIERKKKLIIKGYF